MDSIEWSKPRGRPPSAIGGDPAGVSTETVTVPINSSVATSGPATIEESATSASASVASGTQVMPLYSGPDVVPPTITSVHLITTGRRASAVAVAFSKPMAAATVENPRNYVITSRPAIKVHSNLFDSLTRGHPPVSLDVQSFPIKAATCDPSTRMVTLTLKQPTRSSELYALHNAGPLAGHELTDLRGDPLEEPIGATGAFSIALNPASGLPLPGGSMVYAFSPDTDRSLSRMPTPG